MRFPAAKWRNRATITTSFMMTSSPHDCFSGCPILIDITNFSPCKEHLSRIEFSEIRIWNSDSQSWFIEISHQWWLITYQYDRRNQQSNQLNIFLFVVDNDEFLDCMEQRNYQQYDQNSCTKTNCCNQIACNPRSYLGFFTLSKAFWPFSPSSHRSTRWILMNPLSNFFTTSPLMSTNESEFNIIYLWLI